MHYASIKQATFKKGGHMKTEVIMKRELFNEEISQKSKSEMFSATDLVKAGNKWRIFNKMEPFNMSKWFQKKTTKEFMIELEKKYGKNNIKIEARGRGHHTWVHPLLFIDMALAISPKLKIEVYEWLFDHLIKSRNDSGDSYKRMCGALWVNAKNKTEFPIAIKKVAKLIQVECGVTDWQKATVSQLQYRDKIHDNIALLTDVLRNNNEAVRLGIEKTKRFQTKTKETKCEISKA
jgi:hypothetical protein